MSSTFRATPGEKTGGGCHFSFGIVESLKEGYQLCEVLVVKKVMGGSFTKGLAETSTRGWGASVRSIDRPFLSWPL